MVSEPPPLPPPLWPSLPRRCYLCPTCRARLPPALLPPLLSLSRIPPRAASEPRTWPRIWVVCTWTPHTCRWWLLSLLCSSSLAIVEHWVDWTKEKRFLFFVFVESVVLISEKKGKKWNYQFPSLVVLCLLVLFVLLTDAKNHDRMCA
jgi:hypothetical protein